MRSHGGNGRYVLRRSLIAMSRRADGYKCPAARRSTKRERCAKCEREIRRAGRRGRYEEKGGEETGVGDKYGIISGAKQRRQKERESKNAASRSRVSRRELPSFTGAESVQPSIRRGEARVSSSLPPPPPPPPSSFVLRPSPAISRALMYIYVLNRHYLYGR